MKIQNTFDMNIQKPFFTYEDEERKKREEQCRISWRFQENHRNLRVWQKIENMYYWACLRIYFFQSWNFLFTNQQNIIISINKNHKHRHHYFYFLVLIVLIVPPFMFVMYTCFLQSSFFFFFNSEKKWILNQQQNIIL